MCESQMFMYKISMSVPVLNVYRHILPLTKLAWSLSIGMFDTSSSVVQCRGRSSSGPNGFGPGCVAPYSSYTNTTEYMGSTV